ncbi:MAG: GNAT family N-acetyltransferase [Bacteroidota bacterium]
MRNEEYLKLRPIRIEDCQKIHDAFREQGWDKPTSQYEYYFHLQEKGERDIILAEFQQTFAGYLTVKWQSDYPPFQTKGIPEIVDFNVLMKFQRQGIGSQLMDEAERRIQEVSAYAGIGFGSYQDYGAAQILYIKRGYIPDGNGLVKDGIPIKYGESFTMDDGVIFYLTKQLC